MLLTLFPTSRVVPSTQRSWENIFWIKACMHKMVLSPAREDLNLRGPSWECSVLLLSVRGNFMNHLVVEIGLGYWGGLAPFRMRWRVLQVEEAIAKTMIARWERRKDKHLFWSVRPYVNLSFLLCFFHVWDIVHPFFSSWIGEIRWSPFGGANQTSSVSIADHRAMQRVWFASELINWPTQWKFYWALCQ